jgi:hypothetical protein
MLRGIFCLNRCVVKGGENTIMGSLITCTLLVILMVVKTRGVRWARHVALILIRNAHIIVVVKPENKKQRVRHKCMRGSR